MKNNKNNLRVDKAIFKPLKRAIYLTSTSIAYGILEFRFNKNSGIWEPTSLYMEGIRNILQEAGYYKRYISPNKSTLIQKKGCFIEETSVEKIKDYFNAFVLGIDKPYEFKYGSKTHSTPVDAIRNIFLKQSHNIFNEKWIEHLHEEKTPLLKDSAKKAFFVFQNCIVSVSQKDSIEIEKNDNISDFVVWKNQAIQREFKVAEDSQSNEFVKFIRNVTAGADNRFEAMKSLIGYMCHNYFDPSKGQAVLIYDEALTDQKNPMGGTGKGLVANAIREMRSTVKIDGKQIDMKNRFKFELVSPDTQIIWIDDPNKSFEFELLFSCLTDGWTVERKYMPQFFIKAENSPKVLITSNVILDIRGTSNKRRQFVVELNDYYSSKIVDGDESPVEKEHGVLFKESWAEMDWNTFYSFMLECVHFYLCHGLVKYNTINVEINYLVQKTNEDFVKFMTDSQLEIGRWYITEECFKTFLSTYYGEDSSFKQRGFSNWLKLYANTIKADYESGKLEGKSAFRFCIPTQESR